MKNLLSKDKSILINVRVTQSQLSEIKSLAKQYANGNYSNWIRYAALTLKPSKKELATANLQKKAVFKKPSSIKRQVLKSKKVKKK